MSGGDGVIVLRVDAGVATIRLSRPEARNALSAELKLELARVIREVNEDAAVRAVVVTGTGPAFSAGGDIMEMDPDRTPDAARRRMRGLLRDIYVPLHRLDKPTVAAVNGHAHGAGLSLALACDVVIAGDEALLSLAFARMAVVPDSGAAWFLTRRIGSGAAKELVFTARRLSAAEALEIGLIDRVVPQAELESAAQELATTFAQGPTVALGLAKRMIDLAPSVSLEDMVDIEAHAQAIAMSTRDHREAVTAFREKRNPVFEGR